MNACRRVSGWAPRMFAVTSIRLYAWLIKSMRIWTRRQSASLAVCVIAVMCRPARCHACLPGGTRKVSVVCREGPGVMRGSAVVEKHAGESGFAAVTSCVNASMESARPAGEAPVVVTETGPADCSHKHAAHLHAGDVTWEWPHAQRRPWRQL